MPDRFPLLRAGIQELYGADVLEALASPAGRLLVVAVHEDIEGQWWTLRIEAETPSDPRDRFALALARARADAIVVSGAVLRAEPELRYQLAEPGPLRDELLAFRAAFGRKESPQLWVFSQRGVDPRHPALHGWATPCRLVPPASTATTAPMPNLRDVARMATQEGIASLTIECGPRSCAPLLEDPPCLDEVMLSIVRGPVPTKLLLGSPLQRPFLERQFRLRAGGHQQAPGGVAHAASWAPPALSWSFAWYRRGRD